MTLARPYFMAETLAKLKELRLWEPGMSADEFERRARALLVRRAQLQNALRLEIAATKQPARKAN